MFSRLIGIIRGRERGQILMISALLLPGLLGMTALAVDVGSFAMERRDLQNAADSIALAAAQELPDTTSATTKAAEWATKNDIDASEYTLTFTAYGAGQPYPKVRVQINRNHNFTFAPVLGVDSANNGAAAAGIKASFGGSAGIVPWSVTQYTIDNAPDGLPVVMKYDSNNVDTGNFGAIRIDGPGSATYNTSVRYGSSTVACAITAPNCVAGACPGTYPNTCAENAPECDGPECTPETGNMVGPTRTGTTFRMNNTSTSCDSFDEVFQDLDSDGQYDLVSDCNPWLDGAGKCLTSTSQCSRRVIIIPVIDEFGAGASDPLTIQRFALLFLEGYQGTCTGNECEIVGRFVEADVTAKALAGSYDPGATVHFARLSE